jgi:hypothetical protein
MGEQKRENTNSTQNRTQAKLNAYRVRERIRFYLVKEATSMSTNTNTQLPQTMDLSFSRRKD